MNVTTIPVALPGHGYDVIIAEGGLARAGDWLASYTATETLLCIADANSARLWLPTLRIALAATGISLDVLILEPGEQTKSWAGLEQVCEWLLDRQIERNGCVLALGGGVVGDLTGFAAAIVKRGCRFIQLPTTLLAQVDSSVGGKTAINSAAGKNLVGAFLQPELVLIDPLVLDTLPTRELRAGFAEVVKYGLIDDAGFFAWCETNHAGFFAGDPAIRRHAIATSVTAKARIVAADEMERTGTRALLNLGHTFGHALEAETGFGGALLHGEAVAAGMALAFRYSARRGLCLPDDAVRVAALLKAVGLPSTLAAAGIDATGAALVAHMRHDKKMSGGQLPFLLARGIGATFLAPDVDLDDVAAFLEADRNRV